MKESVRFYDANAAALADQYESVRADQVHACWSKFLPPSKGLVLDVGAGSGRDAAWLAAQGHEVVAVEPSPKMRAEGTRRHSASAIQWIDDDLPGFKAVEALRFKFDLILLSGTWMHVAPGEDRKRAFRKLASLLKPGGRMVFSLRRKLPDDSSAHETSVSELRALANEKLLELKLEHSSEDACGRSGVRWDTVVFELRDDGTGALPLLRHIIVNDAKSSTYKLALLRVLTRIADGSSGLMLERDEDFVTLPFGLVALYWVRAFKPLILDGDFQQQGNPSVGLGFARDGFRALSQISATEFRPGANFRGADAEMLFMAIRDARNTIKQMPAFHTTFPNGVEPIFPCESKPIRVQTSITLDMEFFSAFGTFQVPLRIWDALAEHACWIEPAIIGEWANLMRSYERASNRERSIGEYLEALRWPEHARSTTEVRNLVGAFQEAGKPVYCVWSDKRLGKEFAIDHGLPFARWPNNDLWNLLPASRIVNSQKADRLVSADRLEKARSRILEWWETAYLDDRFARRFRAEAGASLPGIAGFSETLEPDAVFAGFQNQRVRLKINQQLAEWGD